ncbi:MAG TPA: hypothetical protein PLX71_06445 [Phycicoccus sp.]|nr:hypothetical protein [Phycicoccus sp.]
MSQTQTEGTGRRKGLVVLLVSLLIGLGMSFAAAATVTASNAPNDNSAVENGAKQPADPAANLKYGQ